MILFVHKLKQEEFMENQQDIGDLENATTQDLSLFFETQNQSMIPELHKKYGIMSISMGYA
jgi:hypothetical protein